MDFTSWMYLGSFLYFVIAIRESFRLQPMTYRAACGHDTCSHGTTYTRGGHRIIINKIPSYNHRPLLCLDCAGETAAICPVCGRPIVHGDPVRVVRIYEKPGVLMPETAIRFRYGFGRKWAVRRFLTGFMSPETEHRLFRMGGEAYLVCCSGNVCPGSTIPDGFWVHPGKVVSLHEAMKRG